MEYDVLKALWRILELSGGEEVLGQARKLARNDVMETAVARLGRVRDLVEEAGFGDRLAFDFGLMQDLGYYSGLIVEAYAPGVGLPVATGGRYDGLLARFDWDIPGVGFAVAVDRAADALDEAGVELAGTPAGRSPSSAGSRRRRGRRSFAAPASPSVALPEDAGAVEPPLLLRRGGALHAAPRRRPRGHRRRARDRRGAGGRVRIGVACEAGAPPAEVLDLLEAAGLPAASLRGEQAPALLRHAAGAWFLGSAGGRAARLRPRRARRRRRRQRPDCSRAATASRTCWTCAAAATTWCSRSPPGAAGRTAGCGSRRGTPRPRAATSPPPARSRRS